jgi:erythronate-4-phosphate dehydrogenase
MVATATIGTDHLDIDYLNSAGIKWCNAPGCNSGSVRQYIGSVLSHLILEGITPSETTIGIVGVGMVGSKIKQLSEALGFKVLLNDPPRERNEEQNIFSDLETVLKNSDIVTFHTPLNMTGEDKTFHLLNEDSISMLKPGAIVINSSRGEVTKTEAILKGLENGEIKKVVLDVWENEPNMDAALHSKVWIGTPHIAGYSVDGKANGSTMTVHAISKEFGLPLQNWAPTTLPMPQNPVITIDCTNKEPHQIAAEAILQTYNIKEDDKRLRDSPIDFEKQRGAYPIRREFDSWTIIKTPQMSAPAIEMLQNIGFNLK